MELTEREELAAARLAGSTMGQLCMAGAKLFKGTGFVIEKTSGATVTGLRIAAAAVEVGGKTGADFCYRQSDKLEKRSMEYEQDVELVKEAESKVALGNMI